MPKKWEAANRYLGLRKRHALENGHSLEWIESDLVVALKAGELTAKGQQVFWRRGAPGDDLMAHSGLERERGPVAEIPTGFWDSLIFHGGRADWENCNFEYIDRLSGERHEFEAVQISQPETTLPLDQAILDQALAMQRDGLGRDEIAKSLRLQPGFEAVTNEHVRRLLKGSQPRGRPRKSPSD